MSKYVSGAALALAIAAAPSGVFAQTNTTDDDPIVVTATRASEGVRRDLTGASVTAIEPIDLQIRQVRLISDVLRDVPGVSVSRAGAVGGVTQVRMRGAEANHTLVLIDGMEAADPFFAEFDFATLIADDVARIEVLRGQQSALYGSDAIGGVIHYITASGAEAPGVRGRIEYGSFNSFDAAVRLGQVAGPVDFAVSAGYQSSDGHPTSRFGVRDIGSQSGVLSGRFVFNVADNFRIRAIGRYAETNADSNPQAFSGPFSGYIVDGANFSENFGAYGLLSAEFEGLGGRWSNALTIQGVSAGRDSFSGPLTQSGGSRGDRRKLSYVSSLRFGEALAHIVTGAVDYERERFRNTGPGINAAQALQREIETVGLVGQYDVVFDDAFGIGAAIRYDDNERFDSRTTYRVQASYNLANGARLHAAAGSGIKNPTPNELFGFNPNTFIGNPNLRPELSSGWEAGFTQTFADSRAWIDVTYFDATLEDEIFTSFLPGFVSTPANRVTDSTQRGVEISAQATLGTQWRLFASYTYLDAQENNLEEVRRPPHIASVNLSWRAPNDRYGAFVTARYNGETFDSAFVPGLPSRVVLDAFTLLNVGGDVRLTDTIDLYARVENALDEAYEEIFSYATAERAVYVGLRAGF